MDHHGSLHKTLMEEREKKLLPGKVRKGFTRTIWAGSWRMSWSSSCHRKGKRPSRHREEHRQNQKGKKRRWYIWKVTRSSQRLVGKEDGIEKEGWGQIVEDLVYRTSKFGFHPEVSGSCEMFWQTAFPSNVFLLIFSTGIMEYEGGRRKSAASQGRCGMPSLLVPVCATHRLAFHFQSMFPHPWKQCRGLPSLPRAPWVVLPRGMPDSSWAILWPSCDFPSCDQGQAFIRSSVYVCNGLRSKPRTFLCREELYSAHCENSNVELLALCANKMKKSFRGKTWYWIKNGSDPHLKWKKTSWGHETETTHMRCGFVGLWSSGQLTLWETTERSRQRTGTESETAELVLALSTSPVLEKLTPFLALHVPFCQKKVRDGCYLWNWFQSVTPTFSYIHRGPTEARCLRPALPLPSMGVSAIGALSFLWAREWYWSTVLIWKFLRREENEANSLCSLRSHPGCILQLC